MRWYVPDQLPLRHGNLRKGIRNELEKDVSVDAMSHFLKTASGPEEEKLGALCQVICSQFNFQKDPPSVCMYTKKMAYMGPLVNGTKGGMLDLLHALENFCRKSSFVRGLEDLLISGFLTTGYLSEKVILAWFEQGSKRDDESAGVLERVGVFLKLREDTLDLSLI